MFKLLWAILKDKRGFEAGSAAGGALSGAATGSAFGPIGTGVGAVVGGLLGGFSKKKEKEEIYDPYAAQRKQYADYLSGKLGTSTPYEYNPSFDIEQPPVESAAEQTILGRLGNLPTAEEYKGKVEASKTQQIANERLRAEAQKEEESNMYNRLGLVSSTPWMTRAGELGEESLGRQKDIETGMDIWGLDYGLNAEKAMSDIGAQWTGLGSVLGGQQVGQQQWGQQMSMSDLERLLSEEMGYSGLMSSMLGQIAPERTVSNTPNTAMQLLGLLQNQGTSNMLGQIFNKQS